MKGKSASQSRIVLPEPAKATTTRERTGCRATDPFIAAIVVPLLLNVNNEYHVRREENV
jgi:hypothetical protein